MLMGVAGFVGLLAGLAAVYGLGLGRNAGDPACREALETARHIAPLARGEVAAVTVASEARRLPALTFQDASGAQKSLSDWHGRTVLLNLWATWCVPCRKEMPALNTLESELGGPNFEVVAVNIDTRDPGKPKSWLQQIGVDRLAYYADPNARIFQDLKAIGKAFGMPTTLLVDPNGCEIASLAGPAEWASGDALKLVKTALEEPRKAAQAEGR
ncbi:MAG TPA: TlpA disulfide reductase family protein [Xanthobacteraceae bacterium]|jgi:thiol-disulfide isomerase/thioredoxin|nr:TlpA disulfide reductase family protein [Xanthobacteraceae bacterium]